MSVQANLQTIYKNINEACSRVNRSADEVTIIGVTKYVSTPRAEEAIEAGITNLGENRMEGLLEKQEVLGNRAKWHFIGSLQSRKVKDVVNKVDYIHSLDRKSLAKEINKRVASTIRCFVQVNVSGEQSKHGLQVEEVHSFIKDLQQFDKIEIVGLMTMAPHINDEETIRETFRGLRKLRDEIQKNEWEHAPCTELSMGMSNDYSIAIEEGATHIRIGSNLVGSE